MSRSLLGFLFFCLLLALVSAGVVWYVGPTVAGIVVDGQQRANPYFLFQLLPGAAATSSDGDASYGARFAALAADDQGEVLWRGGSVDVVEGSVLLDVEAVQLLAFATGADLVRMLTSSAYRDLQAGQGASARQLGGSRPPDALEAEAATVAVLYHGPEEPGAAPLGVPGHSGWLALLPRYRGQVRWDAAMAPIQGGGDWNRVLLMQFPDTASARSWLGDPETVTERAIARETVDHMVVLVIQPSRFSAPR